MNQTDTTKTPSSQLTTFFPRIIREFEEHDEPMLYCGRWQ